MLFNVIPLKKSLTVSITQIVGLKFYKMNIKLATKNEQKQWDEFVGKSNNGTIFHLIRFQEYHPIDKFNFHNLMFYENDKLVAVLPGQLREVEFISPAGASYGSFVIGDTDLDTSNKIVLSFHEYCLEKKIQKVKMTQVPLPYIKNLNQNIEFTMLYHGYNYLYHLFTSVVDLKLFDGDNIIENFYPNARRNVKKSLRFPELRVEINKDYKSFYPILLKNKKKFKLTPTHTEYEMLKLVELFPDDIILYMCYLGDIPISGVWIMKCNPSVILTFYIASLYEYQEYRPVNRLFYEIIKWAISNGFKYMDLGVSMNTASDNPMEPSPNLIAFKESHNSRGFLRNTLEKIF